MCLGSALTLWFGWLLSNACWTDRSGIRWTYVGHLVGHTHLQALGLQADSLIFDLEDSVAMHRKNVARETVMYALGVSSNTCIDCMRDAPCSGCSLVARLIPQPLPVAIPLFSPSISLHFSIIRSCSLYHPSCL